jgi:hypothetical protein
MSERKLRVINFKEWYQAKISNLKVCSTLELGTYHIKDARLAMFKNSPELYGFIECEEGKFKFSDKLLTNQMKSLIIPLVNEYVKTGKADCIEVDVVARYPADPLNEKKVSYERATKAFDTGDLLLVPIPKKKTDEELIQEITIEEKTINLPTQDLSQSQEQLAKPQMIIQVDNSGGQSVEIVKEVDSIELEQDVDKLRQMFDEKRTAYEQAANDQEKAELNDLLTRIAKRINTLTTR